MNVDRQRWSLVHLVLAALLLLGTAPDLRAQTEKADGRITLALQDADVRDALRMVARQAGVDLVMSNEVKGTVSLDLEDATLEAALDSIVHIGGFEHTRRGNIVVVSTLAELLEREKQRRELEESREPAGAEPPVVVPAPVEAAAEPTLPPLEFAVFDLRYVDAERVQPVVEKVLSERGSASLLMTSDHVAREYSRGGQPAGGQSGGDGLEIGGDLSTSSRGQPAKSHTLVVVDEAERLARVRSIIEQIDVKPAQVLIEARFVEILLDETQRLGIDWNAVASAAGAAAPHTFPFLDGSLGTASPNVDGGSPGGLFPPAPNSVTAGGEAGLFTFGTLDFSSFSAVLRMIRSDSRVQIVSNPRVTVDDRHTATILVGERYPILSANISEFGTVTEQLDRYEPIGVQLEVTPSVLDDGEIELIVRPSTSSLGPSVAGSTGISVARINSRQIDTSVTVANSETMVLGGLITSRDSEESSRVPFFSRVPLFGRLFRQTTSTTEQVELVVFLTVTVVGTDGLSDRERQLLEDSLLPDQVLGALARPTTPLEFSDPRPRY